METQFVFYNGEQYNNNMIFEVDRLFYWPEKDANMTRNL